MKDYGDLNKLINWSRGQMATLTIVHCDAEDMMEITLEPLGETPYYCKRTTIDCFYDYCREEYKERFKKEAPL